MSCSLKQYLAAFIDEHALTSGDEMVLDVSLEEIQALGDFFVRGVCGWMLGLKLERERQHLKRVEVPPDAAAREEELSESGDQDAGRKDPIH
jgi:hypothetical protein